MATFRPHYSSNHIALNGQIYTGLPSSGVVGGQITFSPSVAPGPEFSGLPAEFAAGEVYGLRMWKVDHLGRLRARNIDGAPAWRPGENLAVCMDFYSGAVATQKGVQKHPAPADECRCGFYAYNARDYVKNDQVSYPYCVMGVIKAYGRVLLGTKGFRAEKAEIVALRRSRDQEHQKRVERVYPDIPILGTLKELEEFAPLENTLPDPTTEKFWEIP